MSIAWDYLDPIQKAQLKHFRPDLKENVRCSKCGGQVIVYDSGEYKCLQCSAEHDKNGDMKSPVFIMGSR